MAELRTDYVDDVLDTSKNTIRKYKQIQNSDGTVSFVDVTEYLTVGTEFGAKDINDITKANNDLNDSLNGFGRVTKILDHVTISTSSKQFTLGDLSKYKFLFFYSSTTEHSIYLTSNLIPKEIYLMGKLISNIFFNNPSSYAQIRYQCVHTTKINVYIDVAEGFSTLGFSVYGIE